jgi:hypothetical protein
MRSDALLSTGRSPWHGGLPLRRRLLRKHAAGSRLVCSDSRYVADLSRFILCRRPLNDLFDDLGFMLIAHFNKLLGRMPVGNQPFGMAGPAPMGMGKVIHPHLEVAASGIHAAEH